MKKIDVLLADDEQTIIEGLLKLFDWEGHGLNVVGVANDGIVAVNLARELKPDIMIVDINMPLLSGLDVIRALSKQLSDTVFIIISGYDEFNYAKEALKLKVTDYLLKPVEFSELSRVLTQVRINILENRTNDTLINESNEADKTDSLLYRIVSYLNEHSDEEISLNSLADMYHLNPAYISQFFKNNTGMNYHAYLTLLRINRAKELLTTTHKSIAEIADATGFTDYRAFTRAFKRIEGTQPSQYRNTAHEVSESKK